MDAAKESIQQRILRIRVSLVGSEPEIWRRLEVKSSLKLPVFHEVLQRSFGWRNLHSHRFLTHATDANIRQADAANLHASLVTHVEWHLPGSTGNPFNKTLDAQIELDLAQEKQVQESPEYILSSPWPRQLNTMTPRTAPDLTLSPASPETPSQETPSTKTGSALGSKASSNADSKLASIARIHANRKPVAVPLAAQHWAALEFTRQLNSQSVPSLQASQASVRAAHQVDSRNETSVSLGEAIGAGDGVLFYEYDSNDSWLHRIELEHKSEFVAASEQTIPDGRVLDGGRRGPPEDCGGMASYQELVARLQATDDFDSPMHPATSEPGNDTQGIRELLAWATGATDPWRTFDPTEFNLEHTNDEVVRIFSAPDNTVHETALGRLATRMLPGIQPDFRARLKKLDSSSTSLVTTDAVEQAVRPLQWLLRECAGDGIPLLDDGFLSPQVVQRGLSYFAAEFHALDDATPTHFDEAKVGSFMSLRPMCLGLGLVYVSENFLQLTDRGRAALADPMELWQFTMDHFVAICESQIERDCAMLFMLELGLKRNTDLNQHLLSLRFGLQMLGWYSTVGQDKDFHEVSRHARVLLDRLILAGVVQLRRGQSVTGDRHAVTVKVTKVGVKFVNTALANVDHALVLPS